MAKSTKDARATYSDGEFKDIEDEYGADLAKMLVGVAAQTGVKTTTSNKKRADRGSPFGRSGKSKR